MRLTIKNPFCTLHFVQDAILIPRYSFLILEKSYKICLVYTNLEIELKITYLQVRVYTPKRVFQELETAKEEFIRATFGVGKDQRILLPKIVESFAKDSGLCAAGVIEMIQLCLPDTFTKTIKKLHETKSRKMIEWVPHDFTFRYLISNELVN